MNWIKTQLDNILFYLQDDYDKDLMEMRRRALESMARGKLAPTHGAKKIIVPLNDESSSGNFLFYDMKGFIKM